MKDFFKDLLAINCAENHCGKMKANSTVYKCYSTSCMMNQIEKAAKDIQEKGCEIYKRDFVQEQIRKNVDPNQ